jgi:hypothetical protein
LYGWDFVCPIVLFYKHAHAIVVAIIDPFDTDSLHETKLSFINFIMEQLNLRVDRVGYSA